MNCNQTDALLQDYINEDLSDTLVKAVSNHHQSCNECYRKHENMLNIITDLHELPVPAHSEDFVERALDKASTEHDLHKQALPVIGSALAAGLAVWFFFSSTFFSVPVNNGYDVVVGNEVQTIKVAINSESAIEGVSISIELSPNLELAGFGHRKFVNWNTSLREGVNIISLPIVGIASGYGEIITHIQLYDEEKTMRIKTHYKTPENVRHYINTDSIV